MSQHDLSVILYVIAALCFAAATIGVSVQRVGLIPLGLLASTAAFAQPSVQIGPRGVEVDPGGAREERIVREEGRCRITIIRRTDETGRRITRRIRECDEDDEE